jgi:hypothetical protein
METNIDSQAVYLQSPGAPKAFCQVLHFSWDHLRDFAGLLSYPAE